MIQEIANLKAQRLGMYVELYDVLIRRLTEMGFVVLPYYVREENDPDDTPIPANPLTGTLPEYFYPQSLRYNRIKIQYQGYNIGISLDNDILSAEFTTWSRISSQWVEYFVRYYKEDWDKGVYSMYKQQKHRCRHEDLTILIARVKKHIDASIKCRTLRVEEVAKGKGTQFVY